MIQVGDIVEVINDDENSGFKSGKLCKVLMLGEHNVLVGVSVECPITHYWISRDNLKLTKTP
jgi:hypothetical protein